MAKKRRPSGRSLPAPPTEASEVTVTNTRTGEVRTKPSYTPQQLGKIHRRAAANAWRRIERRGH